MLASHRLYVGTIGQGIFRSTDNGESFVRAMDGMFVECHVRALVVHPRDPRVRRPVRQQFDRCVDRKGVQGIGRNLDRRVEILVPIDDPRLKHHLKDDVLGICLRDNVKARRLLLNGTYQRVPCPEGNERINSQAHFMEHYSTIHDG